jgi:hypothetical protein
MDQCVSPRRRHWRACIEGRGVTLFPYTGILFILGCVIAYKLCRRLYAWNDAGIKRRDAERKGIELERAIREARQAAALRAAAPPKPAIDPERIWDHIPRIAFDLDTQMEFGGSRYHTHYISPEKANDLWGDWGVDMNPGVYITDKYEGPRKIGESDQTRWFIPYDQLNGPADVTRQSNPPPPRLMDSYCRRCGAARGEPDRFCGSCGHPFPDE